MNNLSSTSILKIQAMCLVVVVVLTHQHIAIQVGHISELMLNITKLFSFILIFVLGALVYVRYLYLGTFNRHPQSYILIEKMTVVFYIGMALFFALTKTLVFVSPADGTQSLTLYAPLHNYSSIAEVIFKSLRWDMCMLLWTYFPVVFFWIGNRIQFSQHS